MLDYTNFKLITANKGVNLYENLSNFFHVTSVWSFRDMNIFNVAKIQSITNNSTNDYKNLIFSKNYYNNYLIDLILDTQISLSNSSKLLNFETISSSINNVSSQILTEIKSSSVLKNNFDLLITIFPSKEDELDIFEFLSCDLDGSLYHNISSPEIKLYYPEPFVASPSFIHEEVWFIHILHYQHWLWFFFISLIMFYFITFINVVRWCNPRNKPKRETRGVSRSKCADIITASVPVSWALSIIISETVDATDYYDGFGTGELVVSIRAYQWGWVYYFPKNIDLNYDLSNNYSHFSGNSIKYNRSSDSIASSNTTLEFFKSKKNSKLTSTPASYILSPTDNNNILNFINQNYLGNSTLQNSNAFKKIQFYSKVNNNEIFNSDSDFSLKYSKLKSLYLNESITNSSLTYGTVRQNNFNSLSSIKNNNSTNLDSNSINLLRDWNLNINQGTSKFYPLNIYNTSNNLSNVSSNINYELVNSGGKVLNKVLDNLNSAELYSLDNTNDLGSTITKFDNNNLSYNSLLIKSSSQKLLPNEKSVREFNLINLFSQSKNNQDVLKYLLNAKTVYSTNAATTSFLSNSLPNISFDKYSKDGNSASILSSDGNKVPSYVNDAYWNTLFSNLGNEFRYKVFNNYSLLSENIFLPTITDYVDYDFRNWQSLELLEDSFWESTYNSFNHDDEVNFLNDINEYNFYKTQESIFLSNNSKLFTNENTVNDSIYSENIVNFNLINSNSLSSNDLFNDSNLLNTSNFKMFLNENNIDNLESSYSNIKFLNSLNSKNYINTFTTLTNFINSSSYTQVLNTFKSNNDETLLNLDFEGKLGYINNYNTVSNNEDFRLSNPLRLRSTAKNSISNYNALQKVFHNRLDDGRSNSKLTDVSNSSVYYPFINEEKASYESLLGKNKESFFNLTNYTSNQTLNFNNLSTVFNSLNIYFSDIPFLLANQSDASRHLWFDWSSKWNSIEVQPSSSARYSLLGLPYLSRNFEYTTNLGKEINNSEVYLIRLTKARKNYMSDWSFTPYMYNRISNWYSNNLLINNLFTTPSVKNLILSLNNYEYYWKSVGISYDNNQYSPTKSFTSTPGRSFIQPNTSIQGYTYNISILNDILSKREYLYREYFLNKGYNLNLPKYLISSPNNPLLNEVQNSYTLINPTSFSTEISRDFFYQNSNFLKFTLLNNVSSVLDKNINLLGLNTSILNNYLFFYLLGYDSNYSYNYNTELLKNQYRPMKKGVNNMIRLHATGAIAMPIEIRLHLLASSKDVIHSWAIPSAGIKIDCIPGYSSHRIAIFLVSGIFWGQCMEICGRFHHWMPIIVYFMKRDLFFLWCTHFIHYSSLNNNFDMAGKNLINNLKFVSFNNSNWLSNNYNII